MYLNVHLLTRTPLMVGERVVDFRNLNAETKADSHPLPLIEEVIAKRATDPLISVLDLRHGFHQMFVAKETRPPTCMCTPCAQSSGQLCPWA